VVDGELGRRAFLAGDAPTIADIAMYTYLAHAPEGGVSLDARPNVRAWLEHVESLERFVPMRRTP
jgi:glutathione S-transferase